MSEAAGYHEAKPWAGHQRWACDFCSFDALSETKLREHVETYHALRCDKDGCEFVTTNPHEAKDHGRTHGDLIVLTDSYGRPQE